MTHLQFPSATIVRSAAPQARILQPPQSASSVHRRANLEVVADFGRELMGHGETYLTTLSQLRRTRLLLCQLLAGGAEAGKAHVYDACYVKCSA